MKGHEDGHDLFIYENQGDGIREAQCLGCLLAFALPADRWAESQIWNELLEQKCSMDGR